MQVSFAHAIAICPEVLVLDEITSVLDAHARAYFMNYLGKFCKDGGCVIMSTNIVSEVEHFADHVILLEDSAVKLDMPLSEISKIFCKIRKKVGDESEVFRHEKCVEVGINSDKSISFIIPRDLLERHNLADHFLDYRAVTVQEVFMYYTQRRGLTL
jgi:ABC-type multidrug transport system ATPase subunit